MASVTNPGTGTGSGPAPGPAPAADMATATAPGANARATNGAQHLKEGNKCIVFYVANALSFMIRMVHV